MSNDRMLFWELPESHPSKRMKHGPSPDMIEELVVDCIEGSRDRGSHSPTKDMSGGEAWSKVHVPRSRAQDSWNADFTSHMSIPDITEIVLGIIRDGCRAGHHGSSRMGEVAYSRLRHRLST